MEDYYYHQIVLESSLTIMELIQGCNLPITMIRCMDNDNVTFTFQRTLPDRISLFAEAKLQQQPYLLVDLQHLFTTFYQILKCTEETN